jgi:hypothetical protein
VTTHLNPTGPGSYVALLGYLEDVIRDNCILRDGVLTGAPEEDRPRRLARNTLHSIFARLNIDASREEKDTRYCGAWGGCDLPPGHNKGQADIPEHHHVPPHAGGNVEDCPACRACPTDTLPPSALVYPFLCPGPGAAR